MKFSGKLAAIAASVGMVAGGLALTGASAFADSTWHPCQEPGTTQCTSGTEQATVTITGGGIYVGSANLTGSATIPNIGGQNPLPNSLSPIAGVTSPGMMYIDDATGLGNGWFVALTAAPLTSGTHQLATTFYLGTPTAEGPGQNVAEVHENYTVGSPLSIPATGVVNTPVVTGNPAMGYWKLAEYLGFTVNPNSYAGTYTTTLFLDACENAAPAT